MGETLTADTTGIADADGLANVSYSYQWVANDGTADSDNAGATDSTYTLVAADEGKTIKVKVSFTDDAGNDESLTSAATAEDAPRPNSPANGAPAITGTAQVGETLTADSSGIADADGLANVSYAYQWLSSRDTEIQDATASTYTLVAADESKTIKVRVSHHRRRRERRDAHQRSNWGGGCSGTRRTTGAAAGPNRNRDSRAPYRSPGTTRTTTAYPAIRYCAANPLCTPSAGLPSSPRRHCQFRHVLRRPGRFA